MSKTKHTKGLIEAALDMLEVLEDILPEIECRCDSAYLDRGRHETNSLCHYAPAVKAAIAKARGKEVLMSKTKHTKGLIEAAPDMLEALENLLKVTEGEEGTRHPAKDIARSAIAKARGKEVKP